jgi:hypothetical protein
MGKISRVFNIFLERDFGTKPFGGQSLPTSGCIGFVSDTRGTETTKKYWDDPAHQNGGALLYGGWDYKSS